MENSKYLICPECAYTTQNQEEKKCRYCRTELLAECPICRQPFWEERSMYCSKCSEKLRISYVPIQ